MIGAVVGFLYFNIHPSKLFMGDAGSQFIGLFVAFFGVKYLWNIGPITQNHSWTGIVLALTAFTPAAVDTLTVVINRLKRGQSPMVGGKDHTTHHLVYSGLNDRQVWYVFTLIGFVSLVLSLALIKLVALDIIFPVAFLPLYFLFVFFLLYRNTIRYPEPPRKD
jgi:UDP-GlcNAc:undecaprenyl-phosphate GlcNAc-1-phosphate transferase